MNLIGESAGSISESVEKAALERKQTDRTRQNVAALQSLGSKQPMTLTDEVRIQKCARLTNSADRKDSIIVR